MQVEKKAKQKQHTQGEDKTAAGKADGFNFPLKK